MQMVKVENKDTVNPGIVPAVYSLAIFLGMPILRIVLLLSYSLNYCKQNFTGIILNTD